VSKYYSKRPEYYRATNRRNYYKRKGAGLCTRCCSRPVDPARSRVSCPHCLDKRKAYDHKRRGGRRAAGLCIDCGVEIEPWLKEEGIETCQQHYDARQRRNQISNM